MFSLMGSRRFLPATVLERHRDFGRAPDAVIDYDEPYVDGAVAGAYYQHLVAFAVREHLDSEPDPRAALNDLARRLGVSPGWLLRKLHGQAAASLDQMAEWLMELDLPAPSMQTAIDAALQASPYDRDIEFVSTDDLSPEELEVVRAERLEMLARLRAVVGE